jgi:hypothetical protein
MRRFVLVSLSACLVASTITVSSSHATTFVSSVVPGSYTAGTVSATFQNPSAALEAPGTIVGASSGFPNVLSPFSPHYEGTELTGIGVGGSVTYAFANPLNVIAGHEIGIFNNVGIADPAFPSGSAGNPAQTFTGAFFGAERTAVVEVASNLSDFRSLGRVTFTSPANAFATIADPYAAAPGGASPADFGKPFVGSISSFNGQSWNQILTTLDGSAGGTWLDLSATGLSSFQYIRFSDPKFQLLSDGSLVDIVGSTNANFFINAISANTLAVPEPGVLGLLVGTGLLSLRRRG